MKKIGTRIPETFRKRVTLRIRQTMKPYIKEYGTLTNLCKETACNLDVTWMCVWYWYEGYHLPTLYNLVRFADEFNVSIDFLLGRTAVRELRAHLKVIGV